MAKNYFHGEITRSTTDWAVGDESTNNLPCSGESVQRYIKSRLAEIAEKPSHGEFDGSKLSFYYLEGDTTPLFTISLSTTLYIIDLLANVDTSFTVLSSDLEKIMTISATTKQGTIGSSEYQPFNESKYNYVVFIDSGNGYMLRYSGVFDAEESASFDIRPYIATGDNRIKISITGLDSQTTKSFIYVATVTSMSITVNHSWNTPWIEGNDYIINNIRFAGNVEKTLHISVDGDENEVYTETFGASTSYTTTSISEIINSQYFPTTDKTGIHIIHVWLSSGNLILPGYTYNIMCVASEDITTAKLVCINNVATSAINFTSGTIFYYATYNTSSVTFDVTIIDTNPDKTNTKIIDGVEVVDRVEQTLYAYTLALEYDSEATSGLSLLAEATATGTQNIDSTTIPIDNSNAYIATKDAWFLLKPALRSNNETNPNTFVNVIDGTVYDAEFVDFSYVKDGWYQDDKGYNALATPAGSTINVSNSSSSENILHLIPHLEDSSYTGYSLEFMIKSGYPSSYSDPIMSIANEGLGLFVYPTLVLVKNSSNESAFVDFKENTITHVMITWQRNYGGNDDGNHHLCTIYINGVNNASFLYSGTATWGYGTLSLGLGYTDTYLYMIRAYNKVLEKDAVKNNYLNAMIDGAEFVRHEVAVKNYIVDGNSVSYDLVKKAGFNTMVVEMTSGVLPDYDHQSGGMSNVKFEYAQHQDWNVSITDAPIDGQGTTSMQYFRWNLRWKLAKADTSKGTPASIWTYADGSTSIRTGYFDGEGNHPKVLKIVAKTNYASSMQGHKMGSCGLYHDLADELGLIGNENAIPEGCRTAVYQYPFFGFEHNLNDNTYRFIGLFTVGPDKGDKKTFKFDETDTYPAMMSLEGPNHAPLATRFLTPWTDSNVRYSATGEKAVKEKLLFNGEEGWEVSIAGSYSTDSSSDESSIYSLAYSEWKPAYNFVYYCSPYVVPLISTGYSTITDLNENVLTFRRGTSTIVVNGETRTIKNELVQVYDSSYNLYGFANGFYVLLENLLDTSAEHYIGLTGSPSQTSIIAQRGEYFANNIGNYFNKDWTIYHWCFCVLFALTDNFAKNSYPVKYKALSEGGRWCWRQDDMDTIFKTDNNGNQTKPYTVEHGDLYDGVEIFQGGTSAFWVLVRDYLQSDIQSMFSRIASCFESMAKTLSILGNSNWENAYNVVDYYYWKDTARYFGINGYNFDRDFKYIQPWYNVYDRTYNGVRPLTQALGDQYECEREWVEKRIAYIWSKYRLTGMTGASSGFGNAEFTLAEPFTFTLTPAINYYPVCALGNVDYPSTPLKVELGNSITFLVPSEGATTNYLHGLNYLVNLGDLSEMKLTSRGAGETNIPFTVTSDRLQTLIVGRDLDPEVENDEVTFNANSLGVSNCYSLVTLNAKNVTNLNQLINLRTCPRLKYVYLSGTNIPIVDLAAGARIETLTLPATLLSLYLNNMPKLETLLIDGTDNIRNIYVSNCIKLDYTSLFFNLIDGLIAKRTAENPDTNTYYITWDDLIVPNMSQSQMNSVGKLFDLMEEDPTKYGYVSYNATNDTYNSVSGSIKLTGSLDKGYINYKDKLDSLGVDINTYYIKFKDPVMHKICLDRYQSSATINQVITSSKADADTAEASIPANVIYTRYDIYDDNDNWVKTYLLEDLLHGSVKNLTSFAHLYGSQYSTEGTSFDELQYFDSLTSLGGTSSGSGAFRGWTKLMSVKLPPKVTSYAYSFYQCSSLEEIELPDAVTSLGQSAFGECSSLHTFKIGSGLTSIGMYAFSADSALVNIHIKSIAQWIHISVTATHHPFSTQTNTLPRHLFLNGVELTNVVIPEGTTGRIAPSSFRYCKNITSISIPEGITSFEDYAFANSGITSLTLPDTLTSFGSLVVSNCNNLTQINLGNGTITFQQNNAQTAPANCILNYPNVESIFKKAWSSGNTNNLPYVCSNKRVNNQVITSIEVPNTITTIPPYACCKFNDVISVSISSSVTTIGGYAFHSCASLTSVTIPSSVTSIGSHIFDSCSSLTSNMVIPNGVNSVGEYIFRNCSSLTHITIGSGVTSIGQHFASYCTNLTEVVVLPTTPPTLGAYAFTSSTGNLTIKVPAASLDSYKAASNWASWKNYMVGV